MSILLSAGDFTYRAILKPLIFRYSAQEAHRRAIEFLRTADSSPVLLKACTSLRCRTYRPVPVHAGGVVLPGPFILAAGFIKGDGFADEAAALKAVADGRNIIPGRCLMPALVGTAEFGSFTRFPRTGNPGEVLFRDPDTRSLQNRVGLKNPGAAAAAEFLRLHRRDLPEVFGINIAVTPGAENEEADACASFHAFLSRKIYPAWFTLNLSCPNTEDDPAAAQTAEKAESLCRAVIQTLNTAPRAIPLWVKISPALAETQYRALMEVFAATGVRAVVATNTLPRPVISQPGVQAGLSGGGLHAEALRAVQILASARHGLPNAPDIIAGGGIMDGQTCAAFRTAGASAFQYWSALIYRGPLAPALIARELRTQHNSSAPSAV